MAGPSKSIQRRSTRIYKAELRAKPSNNKGETTDRLRQDERRIKASRKATSKARIVEGSTDGDSGGDFDELELPRRTSSRANKFSSSMREMPGESFAFLLKNKGASLAPKAQRCVKSVSPLRTGKKDCNSPKPPAICHASRRHRVKTQMSVPAEESELSDDGHNSNQSNNQSSEDVEEEAFKIQRIIASRSATREEWRKICENMNTSEVKNGSRWFQEEDEIEGSNTLEERFMVKWADLSYLHCSWELEKDLKEQVDGAKFFLTLFRRKCENGLLFDADDRGDGDFFDPSFIQIDRVLEVIDPESDEEEENKSRADIAPKGSEKKVSDANNNWGMLFDKEHPNYEEGTGRQFLIKWCNTSYSESSYEFERDLVLNEIEHEHHVDGFLRRRTKPRKGTMKKDFSMNEVQTRRLYTFLGDSILDDAEKAAKIDEFKKSLEMHVFPNEGQLRDYQAEGVSWLLANHINKRSSILADEMGLGKTIQTAIYLNTVATILKARGPFLIVAPLSTILHWQREFTSWTDLNIVVYHGSAKDRKLIRELEFAFECDRPEGLYANQSYLKRCHKKCALKWQKTWMIEVVVTTPEMLVTDDFKELTAIQWEVLVVDEAHRLKNHSSKLAVNLRDETFQFGRILLLTGTPIQNNMTELWTLMNIVDANKFGDKSEFLDKFGDIKSKDSLDELHDSIRPYILRRLKGDVEKSVPPKEETLIEVELTVLQKQYYRALYEKNVKFLLRNNKKSLDGPSMNNLAMQLRKCCNHPFLLRGVEIETRLERPDLKSASDEADFIVKASGKLVLLDKLLPKLNEGGHRVLIFSQFKIMLDVLEDYLHYRSIRAERIDGSITGKRRQMAIDRFQGKQGSAEAFVMLLSTRAGGVGINLTAADTCIIFDSDWNPQNDLQAQARCHRIGQSKNVKVYRLLSRKTYEMQMFHMSSLKMGLDQAVLQGIENGATGGVAGVLTNEEVERLLRYGAYDMFNEEKNGASEKESNDFVSQDIESILQRRTKTLVHDNKGSASSVAGGTFSKASFKATSAGIATENVDIDDPEFWIKMIGEVKPDDKANLLGKKRSRKLANYNEHDYKRRLQEFFSDGRRDSSSDSNSNSSDSFANVESDEDISSGDDIAFGFSDSAPLKNEALQNIKNKKRADRELQERSQSDSKSPYEWADCDVNIVLMCVLDYGYGNITWDKLVRRCSAKMSKPYHEEEVKRMCWSLVLAAFLEAVNEDVCNTARRAEREAEKKRELEATFSPPPSNNGGLLANFAPIEERTDKKDKKSLMKSQIDTSFTKLWKTHMSWASIALKDAIDFALTHSPRSNDVIEDVIFKRASASSKRKEHNSSLLIAAFNEIVWPALQSRGWQQVIISPEKSSGNFVYGETPYRSVAAVLDVASTVHPELAHTINSVKQTVANLSQNPEQTGFAHKTYPDINVANVNAQSLSHLLNQHASLEVMVKRGNTSKSAFPRQTLEILLYLNTAHSLVVKADSLDIIQASLNSECYSQRSNVFTASKKVALPHSSWTTIHDSILIRSIVTHGWISREDNWRAIAEDKTIVWGHPFDKGGERAKVNGTVPTLPVDSLQQNYDEVNRLVAVAERAAAFLNLEEGMLRLVEGFDQKRILTTYCIVQSRHTETSQLNNNFDALKGPSCLWRVDEKALRRSTDLTDPVANEFDLKELVSLPLRRNLLKRAKLVLSKLSVSPSTTADAVSRVGAVGNRPVVKFKSSSHIFGVLDQSNTRNIFLAEIISYLLKLGSTGKKIESRLVALARAEVKVLFLNAAGIGAKTGSSIEANDLKKIWEQLELVARHIKISSHQSQNVLRVTLGFEPILPKNLQDGVFPVDRPLALSTVPTLEFANKAPNREQGDSKPGNQAIDCAIKTGRRSADERLKLPSDSHDYLRLTSMEALLLIVICSQGLPVYCDEWILLLNPLARSVTKTPGLEFISTWYGMGAVVEATAESWLQLAKAKLHKVEAQRLSSDKLSLRENIQLQNVIEMYKRDVEVQEKTRDEGKRLKDNPYKLAIRSIMLVEAIRLQMDPKETNNVNDSHNGLGSDVLKWVSRHLVQWASVLGIVNESGRPYSRTCCGFLKLTGVVAFGKKPCREIFLQLGQQTRLRSLFIKYGKSAMKKNIEMAAQHCDRKGSTWEQRPKWWGRYNGHERRSPFSDDIDLLIGITDYGYGGFDYLVSTNYSFLFRHERSNQSDARPEALSSFTQASVQMRINDLTRELSALDYTAEVARLTMEQKKKKNNSLQSKLPKNEAIGRDADSFINLSAEQTQNDDDDSSIEVIDVKYPNSNPNAEDDILTKRKSVFTSCVTSPEKKQKNFEDK